MSYESEAEYVERVEKRNKEIELSRKAIEKKWKRKIDNAAKKVNREGCQHHFYTEHPAFRDNGYGRWWEEIIKTCCVCEKQDVYNEWPIEN